MDPIIPIVRKEPFDDPEWVFELKLDGFRGIAANGRMLSKNGNRLKRFDALVSRLPAGCVLDGEIVATDDAGRPKFEYLMFARRPPEYVVFDVLHANGRDLRQLPLRQRKSMLKRLAKDYGLTLVDSIAGEGVALFNAVRKLDLEGIVAKRRSDPYGRGVVWFKIPNRDYSQKAGRAELFRRR